MKDMGQTPNFLFRPATDTDQDDVKQSGAGLANIMPSRNFHTVKGWRKTFETIEPPTTSRAFGLRT